MMPGGPRNARQMQMMMRRLGMTSEPIDGVEEVIVRTRDREHLFRSPEVTVVTVQGVTTYQVVGQPEVRARSPPPAAAAPTGPPPAPAGPPEEDVRLVMEQGGVPRAEAIAVLGETNGEPAEAILKLLARRDRAGG